MTYKLKFLLCVFLLVFSCATFADLQWDVAAYIWTGTAVAVTAATMIGAAPIVLAGAFAVGFHAGVIGLYWNGSSAPTTSAGEPASKGISVVLDPNTPLTTPDGWTAPVASSSNPDLNPTPPNTAKPTGKFSITSQFPFSGGFACVGGSLSANGFCKLEASTLPEFLQKYQTNFEFTYPDMKDSGAVYNYDFGGDCITIDGECQNDVLQPPSCPKGYSHKTIDDGGWIKVDKSNVICELTDPSKAEKPVDDTCEVRVKNGVFKSMANDPDCANSAVTGLNTAQISTGTAQKTTYLVTTASNDVTVYDKKFDSASNKTVSTIAHLTSEGSVNSVQTLNSVGNQVGTAPGQVNSSNGNTTDGLTTGDTGGSSGSTSSGSGSGLSASDVSSILDNKLGQVFSTDGDLANKEETEPSNLSAPLVDFFNPIRSLQLPASYGACPTATFNLFNKTFVMSQHCDIFESHRQTLKNAFTLIFLILGFRIILSA